MKALWRTSGAALLFYSTVLIMIELRTSQAQVRPYFSDIEGEVMLFAVNTSLSSSLLAGTSLLLAFAVFADGRRIDRQGWLLGIQSLFCLWMALDDRFRFHERLADLLEVNDPYIMATIALSNVAAYLMLFRPAMFTMRMALALTASAAFFFIMLVFDALVPHDITLRLSFEDLAKSWSGFFFLVFAWEAARFRLVGMRDGEEGLTVPRLLVGITPRRWHPD